MKKVYVVKGSDDGNLGVYSNMNKAWVRANAYCSARDGNAVIPIIIGKHEEPSLNKLVYKSSTYNLAIKGLKRIGVVEIENHNEYGDYQGSATIELFHLNQHFTD